MTSIFPSYHCFCLIVLTILSISLYIIDAYYLSASCGYYVCGPSLFLSFSSVMLPSADADWTKELQS